MCDRYVISETILRQIIDELNNIKQRATFAEERDTLLQNVIQDLMRAA